MRKRRYEIRLPLTLPDGRRVPAELVEQTREELITRFGGPLSHGTYRDVRVQEHTRYEDESIRLVVDAEDRPEDRQYFVDLKPLLRARFEQLEIYITSVLIDVI